MHPGVYCLRSNHTGWDGVTMWRTYLRLTEVEAVFRSLKSELGLRPVFHRKPERCEVPVHHGAGLPSGAGDPRVVRGQREQLRLGSAPAEDVGDRLVRLG